jgi:hypothetical protein
VRVVAALGAAEGAASRAAAVLETERSDMHALCTAQPGDHCALHHECWTLTQLLALRAGDESVEAAGAVQESRARLGRAPWSEALWNARRALLAGPARMSAGPALANDAAWAAAWAADLLDGRGPNGFGEFFFFEILKFFFQFSSTPHIFFFFFFTILFFSFSIPHFLQRTYWRPRDGGAGARRRLRGRARSVVCATSASERRRNHTGRRDRRSARNSAHCGSTPHASVGSIERSPVRENETKQSINNPSSQLLCISFLQS